MSVDHMTCNHGVPSMMSIGALVLACGWLTAGDRVEPTREPSQHGGIRRLPVRIEHPRMTDNDLQTYQEFLPKHYRGSPISERFEVRVNSLTEVDHFRLRVDPTSRRMDEVISHLVVQLKYGYLRKIKIEDNNSPCVVKSVPLYIEYLDANTVTWRANKPGTAKVPIGIADTMEMTFNITNEFRVFEFMLMGNDNVFSSVPNYGVRPTMQNMNISFQSICPDAIGDWIIQKRSPSSISPSHHFGFKFKVHRSIVISSKYTSNCRSSRCIVFIIDLEKPTMVKHLVFYWSKATPRIWRSAYTSLYKERLFGDAEMCNKEFQVSCDPQETAATYIECKQHYVERLAVPPLFRRVMVSVELEAGSSDDHGVDDDLTWEYVDELQLFSIPFKQHPPYCSPSQTSTTYSTTTESRPFSTNKPKHKLPERDASSTTYTTTTEPRSFYTNKPKHKLPKTGISTTTESSGFSTNKPRHQTSITGSTSTTTESIGFSTNKPRHKSPITGSTSTTYSTTTRASGFSTNKPRHNSAERDSTSTTYSTNSEPNAFSTNKPRQTSITTTNTSTAYTPNQPRVFPTKNRDSVSRGTETTGSNFVDTVTGDHMNTSSSERGLTTLSSVESSVGVDGVTSWSSTMPREVENEITDSSSRDNGVTTEGVKSRSNSDEGSGGDVWDSSLINITNIADIEFHNISTDTSKNVTDNNGPDDYDFKNEFLSLLKTMMMVIVLFICLSILLCLGGCYLERDKGRRRFGDSDTYAYDTSSTDNFISTYTSPPNHRAGSPQNHRKYAKPTSFTNKFRRKLDKVIGNPAGGAKNEKNQAPNSPHPRAGKYRRDSLSFDNPHNSYASRAHSHVGRDGRVYVNGTDDFGHPYCYSIEMPRPPSPMHDSYDRRQRTPPRPKVHPHTQYNNHRSSPYPAYRYQ